MNPGYTFLYVATLFVPQPAPIRAFCPLIWNSKQTLGYENGIQLQVCCNVTSAKLWPLKVAASNWSLGGKIFEENVSRIHKDMWSELQVTKCDDKPEPTLGYAEARNGAKCKHYHGQTFNMRPRKIPLDSWYLICYETNNDCLQCHFEVLCKNDFSSECANIWMQSSVRAIKNTSMTVWIAVGDHYPLQRWTKLRVNITDQLRGKHLGTFTKENFVSDIPLHLENKTTYVELHIENLQPNSWYYVESCTQIVPPKEFLESYHLEGSLNEHSRQMCQRGLYRTKASFRSRSEYSFLILTGFYFLMHFAT